MSNSKKLLIGISGSIAAFKVAHVISHFRKKNWDVRVITTPSALQFIGTATLEGLSENEVLSSDFVQGKMMSHIELHNSLLHIHISNKINNSGTA